MDAKPSIIGRYLMFIIALVMILFGLLLLMLPSFFPGMGHDLTELIKELGRLFVPIGSITLIYEFILRRSFVAEMRHQLSEVLDFHLNYANELRQAGIIRIHDRLPIHEIQQVFGAERSRIRILTTWIHEYNAISPSLRDAVRGGCILEVLMLKPESAIAKQRSLDLGYEAEHGLASSQTNLRELRRDFASPELKSRVHVKYYDALPSVALHMAGETAFVAAFFPHFTLGTQILQLEVHGLNTPYGRALVEEFEHLWHTAVPVEL